MVCTIDGRRLAVFFTRTGAVVLDAKTGAVRYTRSAGAPARCLGQRRHAARHRRPGVLLDEL